MTLWLLRLTWLSLPLTAGPAAAEALADWSRAPRAVAEVLLWAAWTVGLVALLAPRPVGLTALRTIAPLLLIVAALASIDAPALAASAAIVLTAVNVLLAATPAVSIACAAGSAYGDEVRQPLTVPPALLATPLPIAVALVGTGVVAGPLLLADGRIFAGVLALTLGWTVAGFLARSLHTLSRRWAVLVPAGLVIVDPMTLADPVLFPREQIVRLGRAELGRPADDVVDLRLGAVRRSLRLDLREGVGLPKALASRRGARLVTTSHVLFSPVRAATFVDVAGRRRFPTSPRTSTKSTNTR